MRVPIPFIKTHALGNDFLLVEEGNLAGLDPGEFAARASNRHTGIGADGLVVLGPSESAEREPIRTAARPAPTRLPSGGQVSAIGAADASFRIFNADGGEAELSGNALRCAAAWLFAQREAGGESLPAGRAVRFATRVGVRQVFYLGRDGAAWLLRAEIGCPVFRASEIPFRPSKTPREPVLSFPLPVGDVTVEAVVLSMGNPQCVVFVDEWALVDWEGLGAEIESHPYFPERTNVAFARLAGLDRLEVRFWERGAGHTLSSGTGACAAAVAAHLTGRTGREVTIAAEGGEIIVCWRDDEMVELTGAAEIIATGVLLL